jgi:hypothetical protein
MSAIVTDEPKTETILIPAYNANDDAATILSPMDYKTYLCEACKAEIDFNSDYCKCGVLLFPF